MKDLTHSEARRLFHYDPETGIITRKVKMIKFPAGSVVGRFDQNYLVFSVYGKDYLMHRFIWFYQTGVWPENEVDHKNRNKLDNRWCNLRETTHWGNSLNKNIPSDNTSGVPGVSFHKAAKKWQAAISVNKKRTHLGLFKSFSDAVKARYSAENILNYHIANNNSPAKKYLLKHNLL